MKKVFSLLLIVLLVVSLFNVKSAYAMDVEAEVQAIQQFIAENTTVQINEESIRRILTDKGDTHYYVVVCHSFMYDDYMKYANLFMIEKGKTYSIVKGLRGSHSLSLRVYDSNGELDFTNIFKCTNESLPGSYSRHNPLGSVSEIELIYFGGDWVTMSNSFDPLENMYISITTPRDGFKDNVNIWSMNIFYEAYLKSGQTPEENLSINIIGGKEYGYREVLYHNVTNVGGNRWQGTLQVGVEMDEGENEITAKLKYIDGLNEYYATDTKTYYVYSGVVDEDDDGIDDRTGQPIYKPPEESEYPLIAPQIPEGSGIFGYISWFFQSIFWLLGLITDGVKRMFQQIGSFTEIVAEFFSFLPAEFITMIFVGIMISIVLRVVGR